MSPLEAARLLEALAQGADPLTGEILPGDHICCDMQVSQALALAVRALRSSDSLPKNEAPPKPDPWLRKNGKPNAARPWTEEDNAELLRLRRSGMTPEEIAPLIQRRPRGVHRQLQALTACNGISRAGTPWTQEDDAELARLWPDVTEQALAQRFGRSAYAIHCRLIRLELIPNDLSERK